MAPGFEYRTASRREQGPRTRDEVQRGANARAAIGLISQCKIAPQESPHSIGPWTSRTSWLLLCNCCGLSKGLSEWGVGEQDSVRTPDEDAIWRREMRLKGASGG